MRAKHPHVVESTVVTFSERVVPEPGWDVLLVFKVGQPCCLLVHLPLQDDLSLVDDAASLLYGVAFVNHAASTVFILSFVFSSEAESGVLGGKFSFNLLFNHVLDQSFLYLLCIQNFKFLFASVLSSFYQMLLFEMLFNLVLVMVPNLSVPIIVVKAPLLLLFLYLHRISILPFEFHGFDGTNYCGSVWVLQLERVLGVKEGVRD